MLIIALAQQYMGAQIAAHLLNALPQQYQRHCTHPQSQGKQDMEIVFLVILEILQLYVMPLHQEQLEFGEHLLELVSLFIAQQLVMHQAHGLKLKLYLMPQPHVRLVMHLLEFQPDLVIQMEIGEQLLINVKPFIALRIFTKMQIGQYLRP